MSQYFSTSYKAQCDVIAREQTDHGEIPFTSILDNMEAVARTQIENGENLGYPVMVNKGKARLAAVAEQRRLLHAILTGEIKPILDDTSRAMIEELGRD